MPNSIYRDIEVDFTEGECTICNKPLEEGKTPWSICFDPSYKSNIWGGDTHTYRALLCQSCAEQLFKKGK